jgi:hypothetical protein
VLCCVRDGRIITYYIYIYINIWMRVCECEQWVSRGSLSSSSGSLYIVLCFVWCVFVSCAVGWACESGILYVVFCVCVCVCVVLCFVLCVCVSCCVRERRVKRGGRNVSARQIARSCSCMHTWTHKGQQRASPSHRPLHTQRNPPPPSPSHPPATRLTPPPAAAARGGLLRPIPPPFTAGLLLLLLLAVVLLRLGLWLLLVLVMWPPLSLTLRRMGLGSRQRARTRRTCVWFGGLCFLGGAVVEWVGGLVWGRVRGWVGGW